MSKHRKRVNVYQIDLIYGGPEEGGWYYDIYTYLAHSVRVPANRLPSVIRDLRRRYPNKGYRSSVLPKGTDYEIMVENGRGWDNKHLEYKHYE